MTATPAKIKAYVATIKEKFLDDDNSSIASSSSLQELYHAILKMECLLRGVIVTDNTKLWTDVQKSVGKSLLLVVDNNSGGGGGSSGSGLLPKPLLAGVNVVTGRLAETLYHRSIATATDAADASATSTSVQLLLNLADVQGSLQRCRDIGDDRFSVLLQQPISITTILHVALGYFTAAAMVQSDTPPMWKKVWDTWTLFIETLTMTTPPTTTADNHEDDIDPYRPALPPFEAQVAIESLIRIASSKGNTKRVAELQLKLMESYLNPKRIELLQVPTTTTTTSSKSKSKDASNAPSAIIQCFGDEITPSLPFDDPLTAATKAMEVLEACRPFYQEQSQTESSSYNQLLHYQILQVQVLMAFEEATIQKQARDLYQMNQNRSVARTTLDQCYKQCQSDWIIASSGSSTKDNVAAIQEAAQTLRDSMIATGWWPRDTVKLTMSDDDPAEESYCKSCCFWIERSILRLVTRAEITSEKSGSYDSWGVVLDYILPILRACKTEEDDDDVAVGANDGNGNSRSTNIQSWLDRELEHDNNGDSKAAISLLSLATVVFPKVYWMLLAEQTPTQPPVLDDEMTLTLHVLFSLIHWKQRDVHNEQRHNSKGASSVGSKKPSTASRTLLEWKHARSAVLCFLCQGDNDTVFNVTKDAVTSLKRKDKGQGYFGFLQLLVAWSGWYQRSWPFCAQNLVEVRRLLAMAKEDTGRPLTAVEGVLMELATADAEMLNGGILDVAGKLYSNVREMLEGGVTGISETATALLVSHCANGLARIQQNAIGGWDNAQLVDIKIVEETVSTIGSLELHKIYPLSIWHARSVFEASRSHELSVARQIVAETFIRNGQSDKAQSFLEAAVADSPMDADAALALGGFLLRMALYENGERNAQSLKQAQIALLKAAKLDASRADPFALLGVWFEDQGDLQRAQGCWLKSIGLDPCNPVAGRGLLRLRMLSPEAKNDILDTAVSFSSPLNGWAWHSIGLEKAVNGLDNLAAIAILKGLRSRDVALPETENLGIFYKSPRSQQSANEKSTSLADVGKCYRRLGRFTASLRAFHASIAAAGASVPSTTLVACAQVELELGLVDDAAEKFASVLTRGETSIRAVASYGHAMSLFLVAQRDLQDGKTGASYKSTQLAIDSCLSSPVKFGCTWKLLGDLHSFGASLPPFLFGQDNEGMEDALNGRCVRAQLAFVAKGEDAFRSCLNSTTMTMENEENSVVLKSAALCDAACNLLYQAHILSSIYESGDSSQSLSTDEISDLYKRAEAGFREAIECNPLDAASWCGLGCAVIEQDTLLAQHAFCQSLVLDKTYSDPYGNLGFLYTSKDEFAASKSTMEALTQVADTPMMWMNCAFMLEREAEKDLYGDAGNGAAEERITKAADAYRAALQVLRHPDAQMGLAMTGRAATEGRESTLATAMRRKECLSLLREFSGSAFRMRRAAIALEGVMMMEKGLEADDCVEWSDEVLKEGRRMVDTALSAQVERLSLDGGSLRNIVEPSSNEGNTPIELEDSSHCAVDGSLQRQILIDPLRADLWLSLSKQLIAQNSIAAAREAASRASTMLNQRLIMESNVDARMISETISLDCWLKSIVDSNKDNAQEGGLLEGQHEVSSFAMQRALIMNPGNEMARKGLGILAGR